MKGLASKSATYLTVIVVALSINFALPRLAPGDPLDYIFGQTITSLTPEQRQEVLQEFSLDGPLHEQYLQYLSGIIRGDLGTSVQFGRPVMDVLMSKLPWTLLLAGLATIISTFSGTVLGVLAAWKRGSKASTGLLSTMILLECMPGFWIGIILLSVFSLYLGWFPSFGAVSLSGGTALDTLGRLILPLSTIVLATVGGVFLLARASMLTTFGQGFLLMAEAKGLSEWKVVFKHALRNAILPIYTHFALSVGTIVGGAVVVETVFAYPGVGRLIFDSLLNRDYPLLQGAFLITTIGIIIANLVADLTYQFLDPRVRREDRKESSA